jgi:hypothetical protein
VIRETEKQMRSTEKYEVIYCTVQNSEGQARVISVTWTILDMGKTADGKGLACWVKVMAFNFLLVC